MRATRWQSVRHACSPTKQHRYTLFPRIFYRSVSTIKILQLLNNTVKEDEVVVVKALIRNLRKQKAVAFATVSDGSTPSDVQALMTPEQAAPLSTGDAVELKGVWKKCPPNLKQSHELQVGSVKIIGRTDTESNPLQKKYHSSEFLRQIPHLRIRTPFNSQLSRFRSECIYYISDFLRNRRILDNFVQVHPPLITSSDCEGAGEVFTVSPRDARPNEELFFRETKYLTVSSQLHLEAYAAELGNVWALTPTFRAERSDTPRHLSEFYMLEIEMNLRDDLEDIMRLLESMIQYLVRRLDKSIAGVNMSGFGKSSGGTGEDTEALEKGRLHIAKARYDTLFSTTFKPWPRITYTDAVSELQNLQTSGRVSFTQPIEWGASLKLEHEKAIVDILSGGVPAFVTHYPKSTKPFYMAASSTTPAEGPTVANFDLLFPEVCEIAGGSLREHRLEPLISNMREHKLLRNKDESDAALYPFLQPDESLGSLQWYADLRRWQTAPHGGFGMGFDRLISYLAGVPSLRDVVPFPRYAGRCDC